MSVKMPQHIYLLLLSLLLFSSYCNNGRRIASVRYCLLYKSLTVKQSKNDYLKVGIQDNCITFAVYKCRYKTLLIK